ncbi:MAG: TetR/AcrR family transcriptional regulator [Actinomycetota bacterium]
MVEHLSSPIDQSRRSRKKSKTRTDLMDAGTVLFQANGFDETTTSDIAERADVSQRTLFRHFPTKEALLYGDMDELLLELRDALAARPAEESVLASIRGAMLSLSDNFERHRDQRLLQARLAAAYPTVSGYSRAVVQAQWEREIIAAVADKLGVDPVLDPRPEVVAGATMSAIRIASRQWTAGGGELDFVTLVVKALDVIGTFDQLEQPTAP